MNLGISWHIHTTYMPCEGLALTTCATEKVSQSKKMALTFDSRVKRLHSKSWL